MGKKPSQAHKTVLVTGGARGIGRGTVVLLASRGCLVAVADVGRAGRPEDIAELVAYLISGAAGFVTGQNFVVDGAMTRKMICV